MKKRLEVLRIHTGYGTIKIRALRFIEESDDGRKVSERPFSERTGIDSDYYTRKVRRAVVDFGLNNSFQATSQKMKEHYNLDIGTSTIKNIIYNKTGKYIDGFFEEVLQKREFKIAKKLMMQIDGVMVPVVIYDRNKKKKEEGRKQRIYREVKHVAVFLPGKLKGIHFAVITPFGKLDNFMKWIKRALEMSGHNKNTEVFVLADGAKWIERVVHDEVFPHKKINYLIDFYHLAEYIHNAVKGLSKIKENPLDKWIKMTKEGNTEDILKYIDENHLIEKSTLIKIKNNQTNEITEVNPVKSLYRYINNRKGFFNYPLYRKNEIPNGTGAIESANKNYIKKRMDIPSGWTEKNANIMLSLIMIKENGLWDNFWQYIAEKEKYNIESYEQVKRAA